jgi:hypothetical protein
MRRALRANGGADREPESVSRPVTVVELDRIRAFLRLE